MKSKIILIGLLIISFKIYSQSNNKIVVSVGNIALTSYDIDQMKKFDSIISGQKVSSSEALTKLINMSALILIAMNQPEYYMDESELRKNINSITNNAADPTAKQRQEIYEQYPYIYRMFLRSDKVKKGLMAGNLQIRNEMNKPIPKNEVQKFYNENKNNLKDSPYPKLELVVFGTEVSPQADLAELENIELVMQQVAEKLNTTSDPSIIKKEFGKKVKFTSYSGRTKLLTPDILILQQKIPDEVIGIALRDSIPLGRTTLEIKKNKGIYIPQPIPIRSTQKSTYISLKILDIQEPKQLSFNEAKGKIEEILRYRKGEEAIEQIIKQRISEGQITLTPIDESYRKVFNTFNQ